MGRSSTVMRLPRRSSAAPAVATDLAIIGTPVFFTDPPSGSGNYNKSVIKATRIQSSGYSNFDPWQYDTYAGGGARSEDWFGYTFDANITFSKLIFQEGMGEGGGGFFASGTIKVQVRVSGTWTDVSGSSISPSYDADGSPTYETYTFTFTDITGDGIRVYGDPGGGENWSSVAVIEAWGIHSSSIAVLTGGTAHAKVPTGGSVGTIAKITDNIRPAVGHSGSEYEYDSNDGVAKSEDYWGLTFDSNKEFHYFAYQRGRASVGGTFTGIKVQVRVSGTWTDVSSPTLSDSYPGSAHQIHVWKFTPITGDGIRVYGTVSGTTWTTVAEVVAVGKAA